MLKAAIIGSGNIAHHFLPALILNKLVFLSCLHSRNEELGLKLCRKNKIAFAKTLQSIPSDTSIIFLMVNDDSITSISNTLSKIFKKDTIIVHFSGTNKLEAIDSYFTNTANVWPIYSISIHDLDLVLDEVPICISANHSEILQLMINIFSVISSKVIQIDQEQKSYLHLSAVVANNFTNHLLALTKNLMDKEGLDFNLMTPIIHQTLALIQDLEPAKTQTGPAARGDQKTIEKHLDLLKPYPQLKEVYQVLTKSIIKNK